MMDGRGLLFLAMLTTAGCGAVAHRTGAKGAQGVIHETRRQIQAIPQEQQAQLVENAARGVVRGTLDELSRPERVEQLAETLSAAVTKALQKSEEPEPGTGGSGMGIVHTIMDEVEPRARALGHQAAAGFVDGLRESIPWVLVTLIFLTGLMAGGLVGAFASARWRRD